MLTADAPPPPAHFVEVAPQLKPDVARRAWSAMTCQGVKPKRLVIVDMGESANKPRLWAFSIDKSGKPKLIVRDYVSHGAGSDPGKTGKASRFSNTPESHMTSLGLYRIGERYKSPTKGWFARRLDGLLTRWNSNARTRAVVMHPADYVREGAVGRSLGCPAVRQPVMDRLEKEGLQQAYLWIDGPDAALAKDSQVSCPRSITLLTKLEQPAPREVPASEVFGPSQMGDSLAAAFDFKVASWWGGTNERRAV